MKRKLVALTLAVLMAVSLIPLARAAGLPFKDVPQSQWYYNDVVQAYESGLVDGISATTFGPDQSMTYAQAVKLAACMHQTRAEGAVSLTVGEDPWYSTYVDYCKANNIISKDYRWNGKATRAGYAEIFAAAMPDLAQKNTVVDNAVPDVKTSHPQAAAIYKLYRAGVVVGSTKDGVEHCFNPDSPIKRAEVAAILTRMMNESARLSLTMDKPYTAPAKPVTPVTLAKKYDGGGANDQWYVEEATIGAPICVDLDKNGRKDIVYAGRSLFCLDAATGKTNWRTASGTDTTGKGTTDGARLAADLAVADVDKDGKLEIVAAFTHFGHGTSVLAVYDDQGRFENGWPVKTDYPIRTVVTDDLDKDGKYEIIVGLGVGADGAGKKNVPSLYVYEPDGKVRQGWPQNSLYGFYNHTLNTADLNGDGVKEIVGLYDGSHTRAWHADGALVTATGGPYAGLLWNNLPVTEDYDHEMVCVQWARNHDGEVFVNGDGVLGPDRKDRYAMVGTVGGVVQTDVDGNGSKELVYTGMIVDASILMRNGGNTYEGVLKYYTTFLLNNDRTRYANSAKGYDWTAFPTDPAPVVSLDATEIPTADMRPVVEDLDNDGSKEILYAANDGQLHCWSLDKKQKNKWPIKLSSPSSSVKEFATRPVALDVNKDGWKEVIFATYTQTGQTAKRGTLYVADYQGNILSKQTIPVTYGHTADTNTANGCQATPCVADVDGDGKYEVALTTLTSGLMVYDLDF